MKTQRRSRFTHPLQALSAEFSIIVWFAAVIAQGENTKTKPTHAPSSGFPVSEFGIIIWFADVRAQVWLKSVQSTYSYGTSKVSCFSWRHTTILVAARPETWQFWSRRELHFSLLDERLSILVVTSCYEAPQDLLISGRQTRQNSSRREMRRGKTAERDMCIN